MLRGLTTVLAASLTAGVLCAAFSGCGSAGSSSVKSSGSGTVTRSDSATQLSSAPRATVGWQKYLPRPGSRCQISYKLTGVGISSEMSLDTMSSQLTGDSGVVVSTETQQGDVGGVKTSSSQPFRYVLSAGKLQLPASAAGPTGSGQQASSYVATGSLPALSDFGIGENGFESMRVSSSANGEVAFRVRLQRIPDLDITLGHGQRPTPLVGVQVTYVSVVVAGASASEAPEFDSILKAFKPANLYLAPGHGLAYLSGPAYSDVTSTCSG